MAKYDFDINFSDELNIIPESWTYEGDTLGEAIEELQRDMKADPRIWYATHGDVTVFPDEVQEG